MAKQLALTGPGIVNVLDIKLGAFNSTSVRAQTLWSGVSHGTEQLLIRGLAPKFASEWDETARTFRTRSRPIKFPVPLGYECVARIAEVGREVSGFRIGDLLWLDAPHQDEHVFDLGSAPPFRRLPSKGDPRAFTFFALSRVALGAVHDAAPLLGDRAAVIGLGAIGLICVQLLQRCGVSEVLVADKDPNRVKLACNMGARALEHGAHERPRGQSTAANCDFAIEASGAYDGLTLATKVVAVGGRVIVVSSFGGQVPRFSLGHEFHRNKLTLISSMTINGCPHPRIPQWNLDRLNKTAEDMLADGVIAVTPLIGGCLRFPSDLPEYLALVEQESKPPKYMWRYDD